MNYYSCLLVNNPCYLAGAALQPQGIVVHSTGANNPNLRRYVQPAAAPQSAPAHAPAQRPAPQVKTEPAADSEFNLDDILNEFK